MMNASLLHILAVSSLLGCSSAATIDLAPFEDSRHHWYDVHDEKRLIDPLPDQQRVSDGDIRAIADNILLYQNPNGGWPKNYDMQAELTPAQRQALVNGRDDRTSTIDNGATHTHIEYLAEAFTRTNDERYRQACERGIDYLLAAQYPNGGWPQYWPDTSGYRRFITYNDGAMIGVMKVLRNIATSRPQYAFVDAARRERVAAAFQRGLSCILQTQIVQDGVPTGWCQQHDDVTLAPQWARTFEPAAVASLESAQIVEFLMSLQHPSAEVIRAIEAAVEWFRRSGLEGIRVETVKAQKADYQYHTTSTDKVVVQDPDAPTIWARFYELRTNTPLFCNRDGHPVYSLAEVDRERRTGYGWYVYDPADAIERYVKWKERHKQRLSAPSKSDREWAASLLQPVPADSVIRAIEADRKQTEQWLRSSPSSYLAAVKRIDFGDRSSLTIGRSEANDVQVDDPAFEERHVRVTVVADSFLVESLAEGATFGPGAQRRAVLPPSAITIGRFSIRLSHQRFPALIVFDTKSPRFAEYTGLRYFPVDLAYRYELPLTPNPQLDTVVIQSTRGNLRNAVRVGWFEFSVGGTACRLEALRLLEPSVGEESYSVLFRDRTSGRETYGMGRYVEAEPLPNGRFLLDFNRAYNPACAFSGHYNCPIPPEGNSLPVEIRAGEKVPADIKH
jgi:PelA/Pel-15E family pectate lyase